MINGGETCDHKNENNRDHNCSHNIAAVVHKRPKQQIWLPYGGRKQLLLKLDLVCVIALSWDEVMCHIVKVILKLQTIMCITCCVLEAVLTLVLLVCIENITTVVFLIFTSLFSCFSRPPVTSVLLRTRMSPKWQTSMESSIKVWIIYAKNCGTAVTPCWQLFKVVNISHLK